MTTRNMSVKCVECGSRAINHFELHFSALAIIKFGRKNVDFEFISNLTNRPYNRCDNSSYISQIHEYFLQTQKM